MDEFKLNSKHFFKRSEIVEFDDFLRILRNASRIFGYPDSNVEPMTWKDKIKTIFKKILRQTGRTTLIFSMILYIIWIAVNYNDLFGMLRALPSISSNSFVTIRYFILEYNLNKIRGMKKDIKEVYNFLKIKHSRTARKHLKRANLFQVFSICILIFTQFTQMVEFISNYLQHGTEVYNIQIWLPFDHHGEFKYFLSCFIITFTGFFCSTALYLGDWMIYSIIYTTSLDFEMIGKEFQDILGKTGIKLRDLSPIIEYHSKLIEVCNQLESIVNESLLHNYLQGIGLICFISFQLAILKDPTQLIVYGLVLIIVFSQIFMLCFHGQLLIDTSSQISEEIYLSNWYLIKDLEVKKAIPFLMQVGQKKKNVTAGGFVVISMETLTYVS